jgi:hypothetical protein
MDNELHAIEKRTIRIGLIGHLTDAIRRVLIVDDSVELGLIHKTIEYQHCIESQSFYREPVYRRRGQRRFHNGQ